MGRPLSKEHKEKIRRGRLKFFEENPKARAEIGAAQKRAALERLASLDTEAITHKKCSACKEVKEIAEFATIKAKLKCGLIYVRPEYVCRPCKARKSREWRKRRLAEGVDLRAKQRERYAARDEAQKRRRRELSRENAAIRRREEGKEVRGPYKKRKDTNRLPVGPISEFVTEILKTHPKEEVAQRTGLSVRLLYRIERQEEARVEISTADALLLAFDGDMNLLYPPEEPERIIGYGVLDPKGILKKAASE